MNMRLTWRPTSVSAVVHITALLVVSAAKKSSTDTCFISRDQSYVTKFYDCVNAKVMAAKDLKEKYAVEMENTPVFGHTDGLAQALSIHLSMEHDCEAMWGTTMDDGEQAIGVKTQGELQFYLFVLNQVAAGYDDLGMFNESTKYFQKLVSYDSCKTAPQPGNPSASPLLEYEKCSSVMYTRIISNVRHSLGQPTAARQWFKKAKQVEFAGKRVHRWKSEWQTPTWFTPRLRSKPFWTKGLPLASWLEEHYATFKEEFLAFLSKASLASKFNQNDYHLITNGSWSEHKLFDGKKWSKACKTVMAKTCELLKQQPDLMGSVDPALIRGPYLGREINVFKLEPGARLKPHCGATNSRLYCHVGLVVPEGPWLRVGPLGPKRWREGKALCFDDSFEHEAWHNGTEPRYVLMGSVWHPDLRTPGSEDPEGLADKFVRTSEL